MDTHILRGSLEREAAIKSQRLEINSRADLPISEAQPIIEFLNLQRSRLTCDQFRAYLNISGEATEPCDALDTTRILDMYVTAGLWRVFGISWRVYYAYTSLASTGVCLLIFCIGRRLSGSYWAGLLAAVLFCASPFETYFAIRSLRDISPLWFATLAFAFFACRLDQFRSRKLNLLSFLILGILAMVGRGWRVDVLLLIPFLLVGVAVVLYLHRRSWKYAIAAGCLFLAGAWGTDRGIRGLCPEERGGSENAFHPAYYGDFSRCNLLGLENSLQISRDDVQTYHTACLYSEANNPPHPALSPRSGGRGDEPGLRSEQGLRSGGRGDEQGLRYISPEYGQACKDIFTACLKYHLYQYIKLWPKFYWQAVAAFPDPDMLQGEDRALLKASRLGWALPAYRWCLDPLTAGLPYLHLLGIVTLFWMGRDKVRGAILVAFGFYYSVIWLLVLPEHKHMGQLLLPLTVTGGIGLWGVFRLGRFLVFNLNTSEVHIFLPAYVRLAVWVAAATAACWVLSCLATHHYSVRQRAHYVHDIRMLAGQGTEADEAIKDSRVFSTYLTGEEPAGGYLLTIQAGGNPGYLACRHVHFPSDTIPGRVMITHHKLHEGQIQYFAVSCLHAAKYGDNRPYACTVIVNPGTAIVGCRKLDLSNWKRLPFSTIFCDGERMAGSPYVGHVPYSNLPTDPYFAKFLFNNLSSEVAYGYPWELLSVSGLPFYQNFEYPGLRPIRLVLAKDDEARILRAPATFEEANQSGLPLAELHAEPGVGVEKHVDGLHLQSSPGHAGPIASYAKLTAPEEAVYLVKMTYRQPVPTDLQLRAVQADGKELRQKCFPSQENGSSVRFLEMKLRAGEAFQLQLLNPLPSGTSGGEIVVEELQVYRERFPLWDFCSATSPRR